MASTAVKERPILFSAPMVRAILDGRKTMTRRVVKLPRGCIWYDGMGGIDEGWYCDEAGKGWWHVEDMACPYGQPGERLWVREAWLPFRYEHIIGGKRYAYRADSDGDSESDRCRTELGYKWKPPIHMPRKASRLTLEITEVRVERLQDITENGASLEGVHLNRPDEETYYHQFSRLWEHINGKGSWSSNPWVWVVSFKRMEVPQ